jgi:hypothetical protein
MVARNDGLPLLIGKYMGNRNSPLKTGPERPASQFTRKWRSLRYYYQEEGYRGLVKKICASIIRLETFGVFEIDLMQPVESVRAQVPISIKLLSMNEREIDRLVEFWPDMYAPPYRTPGRIRDLISHRLSAGEECLYAEHEGKIIYMNWHGFQNTHLFNPQARQRGIGPDEALSYNTYCDVAYRGKKIHDAVIYEMFNLLKNKGYKKLIVYVLTDNRISGKSVNRVSGKQVQTQRCASLLGFNFYFLSKRLA